MMHSVPTARTSPALRSAPGLVTPHAYAGRQLQSPSIRYRSHGYAARQFQAPNIARGNYQQHYNRLVTNGGRLTAHNHQHGSIGVAKESKVEQQHVAARDHHNLVSDSVRGVNHVSMVRNNVLASNLSREEKTGMGSGRHGKLFNNAVENTHPNKWDQSFHGKFADKNWDKNWSKNWNKNWAYDKWNNKWHWRHHHPIIAFGWYGPLFWPYAYWDFVDYTFWPYPYDVFWPYAYDDLYVGVFGPYSYEGPAYVELEGPVYAEAPFSRHHRRTREQSSAAVAVVCSVQAPALTNWPIQQIAQTVQPDEAQQSALNELKDATAKAMNVLQSACPDQLPSTPTARLEAMRQRIGTMLHALGIIKPPLQRFYDSLNDEQKSRFDLVTPQERAAPASASSKVDVSEVCGEQALQATNAPIERVLRAVKPNDVQRTALDALDGATKKAADFLEANCPVDQALTPPGRVAAMEKRLNTMMEAINIVQPALQSFYGLLTDEQKARFNQLGGVQG